MNKLLDNHPSIEALAQFAEGRSPNPAAIEAHLDTCESCALDVLAGREAIALESLGTDEFRLPLTFETRARRELLATVRSQGPPPNTANQFGALEAFGLLAGLGGFGSVGTGSDLILAEGDQPVEISPHSEKPFDEGETSGRNEPSPASEDDISRMLDQIRDVLSDPVSDHPADLIDPSSFADRFSDQTDSTRMPEAENHPHEDSEDLDYGSADAAEHRHHDTPLEHGQGDDDDFHG